ncbi:hypothetical protein GN956_G16914 [Arapaima gigas]
MRPVTIVTSAAPNTTTGSPSLLCREQVTDVEDQCHGDTEEEEEEEDAAKRPEDMETKEAGQGTKEGGAEGLQDEVDGGEEQQGLEDKSERENEAGQAKGHEGAVSPCFISLGEVGTCAPTEAEFFSSAPPPEPAGGPFCPDTLSFCPQEAQQPYPLKRPYSESPAPEALPLLPILPSDPAPRPLKLSQKVVNLGELQPLQVKLPQVYTTRRYTRCSARSRASYLQYPHLPAGGNALRLEGPSDPALLPALPKKKTRTLYTTDQLEELERLFREDHYPDSDKRKEIAATIGVTPQRIMVWFQNRRAKWRKAEKTGTKQDRRQTGGVRGSHAPTPAQLNVSAPPARPIVHTAPGPRLAPQPHYSTILPSCPSPPGGSGPAGEQGSQPMASVGLGGTTPVEYVPLLMLSPPPLRRATLPLVTSYLPANHLAPLLLDAADSSSAALPPSGATREGHSFPQQSDNTGSSSSLFDYGDVMGGAMKLDTQHYVHTSHQGGAVSYQLGSYPQQPGSLLPSSHSHLAQYPRLSYLPPTSSLTAAVSDSNPTSYLTFGAAGTGGVMTYTTGGHTYFQSQNGNPILLQTGLHAYQPCPWGDVYAQPSQYPSTVYHRPQYPNLGRDASLYPPGPAAGLLPAQHCIPLQRPVVAPPTTVYPPSQRPPVGAASAFQTPTPSVLRPPYENPERAEQTDGSEAEAGGGKSEYEPEPQSGQNPLPESHVAESNPTFDCDFSPIQF